MDTKTDIHQQLENWKQAVISQDIDLIMRQYDDNVRAFDAIVALEFKGRDAYQTHWQSCLEMCKMTRFEIDHIQIEADGNLAVCSFLNHCGGIDEKTGEEQSGWVRGTQVYQKRAGQWLIVHEHFSLPFDMESGAALFNLSPAEAA